MSIHTQVSHPCSSHRAPIHHLSPLSDPFSFVVIVLVIVVVDLLLLVPISSHASQPPHRNSKPPALRSFRSSKLLQAIGLLCIGKRQVVRIAIAIAIAHPILITSGLALHSRLFRPLRRFVIGTTATGPLPDHLCESMCPLPPLHSRQTVLCSAREPTISSDHLPHCSSIHQLLQTAARSAPRPSHLLPTSLLATSHI